MNRLPVIETERLRLRPLQMEDSPHVFAIFSNERVLQHYGMEPHQTLEETEQMLTHMLAQIETGAIIRFAIEHRESNALIGTIGFHNRAPSHRRAEIGYELRPEYWRSGYATEALHAVLQFAETCEIERVGAIVYIDNLASQRMLEKNGFVQEGRLHNYMRQRGQAHDVYVYSYMTTELTHPSI
ncbi:GNAT family N-acetyltransferase [Exiguobacterium sp. B2(2022)]|uniref:GNAT family N-acetyltransferase n=1 Tax=Exiguobacterium sp. B2(2022) TaxID=2992755 RepID=UPI00237B35C5|nr:GNAT family N-acetyltransferase [Exiguobacterium sp. B2(2022)]MDE0564573.1 GNAT family N-acetyltransferase [Exiguobacterium sp. B2(2022)]